MAYAGFPRNVRQTPVPNPLLSNLLAQIDDLTELKVTLRVIWQTHQKHGHPRFVYLREVLADPVLVNSLRGSSQPQAELRRALDSAVDRGTLVTADLLQEGVRQRVFALNNDAYRQALARLEQDAPTENGVNHEEPEEAAAERSNVFALYEDNIGMLSPMIAEQLREAEQEYPASWIEDAVREAVSQNARSWRYISRILERWREGGKDDRGPVRRTEAAGYEEYFRR